MRCTRADCRTWEMLTDMQSEFEGKGEAGIECGSGWRSIAHVEVGGDVRQREGGGREAHCLRRKDVTFKGKRAADLMGGEARGR